MLLIKSCQFFILSTASPRYNSVRSFRKNYFLNSVRNSKLFYTNALLASTAAIGISLYIANKKKIGCDIDLKLENNLISNERKYEEAIIKSRDLLQRIKDEAGIPGLVVGVNINGKTIWKEGFGYADVENRVLCTPDTVMRIASISKSITMAAVAKLWEQGKLDLDKPVQEYVPYFPQKYFNGKPVTITCRQLISHLGGIRHYKKINGEEKKGDEKTNNKTVEEMDLKEYYLTIKHNDLKSALDLFKNDPLYENPGTKFLYTTHGYTLVSAIVEAVSKEQFTLHMTKLFKTLGMKSTYLDENDVLIYNRSRNYKKNKRGWLINAPYVDNSYKWAGGGFLSTVGDLIQFGNAMLYSLQYKSPTSSAIIHNNKFSETRNIRESNDKVNNSSNTFNNLQNTCKKHDLPGFLSSKSMETMWEPVPPAANYGMGWFVLPEKQECQFCDRNDFLVWHTGGAVGASSVLLIVPKTANADSHSEMSSVPNGIVVAVLSNMDSIGLSRTAFQISKIFQDH